MVFALAFLPLLRRCLCGLADSVKMMLLGYLGGFFRHALDFLVRNFLQTLRQVLTQLILYHLEVLAHHDIAVHELIACEFEDEFRTLLQ